MLLNIIVNSDLIEISFKRCECFSKKEKKKKKEKKRCECDLIDYNNNMKLFNLGKLL